MRCFPILIFLGGLFSVLSAADERFIPEQWSLPGQWKKNASVPMRVEWSREENALHFSADFGKVKNRWIYPVFTWTIGETLAGIREIEFEMKIDASPEFRGIRESHVMLPATPSVKGYYPYRTPPPGRWQTIRVKLPDRPQVKKAGIREVKIGMNPIGEKISFYLRRPTLIGTPGRTAGTARIRALSPGTVFCETDFPEFEISIPEAGLRYRLSDWKGTLLREGPWKGRKVKFSPLPPGYYFLSGVGRDGHAAASDRSFAVVVDPSKRRQERNSFFGVDTAQSWLAGPGGLKTDACSGDGFLLVSELVRLAGIPNVRDRLSWNDVNAAPGRYEWGHYKKNAELLSERKIAVSSVYARCPKFVQTVSPRLPDDLLLTWRFARDASRAFRGKVTSWEVWNEPDIHYAPEPVWEFAATLKAAFLGHKAGAPEISVLPGAVCSMVRTSYDDGMYANDVARYAEAMNFHTYSAPARYPQIFAELRSFLKKNGLEHRAIYVTENGTNLEGLAQEKSILPGLFAHSPEQELIVAEFLPKSQILLMMEGVARSYFFVFPPCNEREGKKDWGILRRDGSVKPVYTAFSTLTFQLAAAELLGEIKGVPGIRQFLFALPDGTQTVVFWSISELDRAYDAICRNGNLYEKPFFLSVPSGRYPYTDIMGGRRNVVAENGRLALSSTRFPAYVSGLSGLKADTPPHPAGRLELIRPGKVEDRSIVIKPYLNREDFRVTNLKSLANLEKDEGRIHLDLWNLSPERKTGRLLVSGGVLKNLPENLVLPPFGKVGLDLLLEPSIPEKGAVQTVRISGVFQGKKISHAVIPVHLNRIMFRDAVPVPLDTEHLSRWRRNDSAAKSSITYDAAEKALRFDAEWKERNAWIYPEYVLKLPEESFRNARMLTFEIKSVQDKVENDFHYTYVMLSNQDLHEHGKVEYLEYPRPLTEWEIRCLPLHSVRMPLDSVRMIRIGMNPKGKKLTFWIRNLRIYRNP